MKRLDWSLQHIVKPVDANPLWDPDDEKVLDEDEDCRVFETKRMNIKYIAMKNTLLKVLMDYVSGCIQQPCQMVALNMFYLLPLECHRNDTALK